MSDFDGIEALTFDCYGTLIDWDRGIRGALSEIPQLEGLDLETFVRQRELDEREVEAGAYLPYDEVLAQSVDRTARANGVHVPADALRRFAGSVATWPPFDETRDVLDRLASRFRLAILSNVDTAVLARSIEQLGAPFAAAVTSEEVRSYKPREAHFEEALRRLDLDANAILHVAQSHYHDVVPARRLGWRVAWINRLGESCGAEAQPTLECSDLDELARALGV